MHQPNVDERIIAVDLRSSRFGFAVFEGPNLLDWGVRNFRQGADAVKMPANVKLGDLMGQYLPRTIVLTKRDVESKGRSRMRKMLESEAGSRDVPVHVLSPFAVKSAFLGSNHNKYQVAAAVIERFPELASRRPGVRKIWKPEDYVIKIFDAAAIGIAYFSRKHRKPTD